MHQGRIFVFREGIDVDHYIEFSDRSPLDRLSQGLDLLKIEHLVKGGDGARLSSMFIVGLRLAVEYPEYGRAWVDYLDAMRPEPVKHTLVEVMMRDIPLSELSAFTVALKAGRS